MVQGRLRCGLILWWGAWAAAVVAAEPSAAELARRSREAGALNLVDLTAELKLTTTGKDGKAKEQVLRSSARRIGGRMHGVARFSAPAGVAGVAVLTVEGGPGEADAVTLYLPKLKRTRKVASGQRGDAFMQTDFSYADLGAPGGVREDAVTREKDDVVDGRPTYVLRSKGEGDSPYGEVRVWIDRETFVPLRATYADRVGKPLKEYRALKLRKFEGRVLAATSSMKNLQTGSATTVEVLSLDRSTLGDDAFTERALERG